MELTGLQNPMVKAAAELKQKKYRQQQGLFLAEGLRTVEEAVRYGAVQSIFYTAIEDDRTRAVLEEAAAKQIKLVCVSDKVLKKIADTETPQGIIAVCEMRSKRLDDFLASGKMLLVLDRVTDPGNIGTMLRTADAAGVGGQHLGQILLHLGFVPPDRGQFRVLHPDGQFIRHFRDPPVLLPVRVAKSNSCRAAQAAGRSRPAQDHTSGSSAAPPS